ncbi:hypothetical protein ACOMHN_044109 [Nucella lapillus]
MKRFQVKCRKCRHWLMSEESIVDCHGDSVQGDRAGWDCGPGHDQITHTHLFVSFSVTPPFVLTCVEEACYTQGKITCPKCQGRLGSFDFVRTNRRCACRRSVLPPIHLLRDRVDVLPSPQSSPSVSLAPVADPVVCDVACESNGTVKEGEYEKGGEASSAQSDMNLESLSNENSGTTERKTGENRIAAADKERNVVLNENEDSGDDIITDVCRLFGQSPLHQQCSAPITAQNAQKQSRTDVYNCRHHSNIFPCQNEDFVSSAMGTLNHEQWSDLTLQSSTQDTSNNTAHSQQMRLATATSQQDCLENRSCRRSDEETPLSVATQNSSTHMTKQLRRDIRRKRNKHRDFDIRDELDRGTIPSDVSEIPVHFEVIRPHLFPSNYRQRETERREREAEEKRQIQEEDLLWDHTCPMCLDVMGSPHTTLPCEHNFCEGCLRRLTTVISPEKSDCPLCRRRIAQCVPNTGLELTIRDKYPAHLRQRLRDEKKRHNQRFKHTTPLPGLPFPHRFLWRFPRRPLQLSRTCRRWLMVVAVSVVVVVALTSLGMEICKRVLHKLAEVYDDLMERLTGERLWSHFMAGESRMLTVCSVFVLYLLVACVGQYLQLFQYLHN